MIYVYRGHTYQIYQQDNKMIAVSSYAGRTVKGYARCAPEDKFDPNIGMKLAAARCAYKIEKKRAENIKQNISDYKQKYNALVDRHAKATAAYSHCNDTCAAIMKDLSKF